MNSKKTNLVTVHLRRDLHGAGRSALAGFRAGQSAANGGRQIDNDEIGGVVLGRGFSAVIQTTRRIAFEVIEELFETRRFPCSD